MILTVTLNPSVDKLYQIDALRPHEVMRVKAVEMTAGGKGLNVSRAAALLGEPVQALGFVGGHTGALFSSLLQGSGVTPCFTPAAAETRCCVNIREPGVRASTELLEPGSEIRGEELEAFVREFDTRLPGADAVTLSGSLPRGVPADFYALLVQKAKRAGKPVLLDASGEPLRLGLAAGPDFIKPNTDELCQLLGSAPSGQKEILLAARQLRHNGIKIVAVSMGRDGVIVSCPQGDFRGRTPDVPVVNTVGCGDSMVAAFAVGMARRMSIEEQIRLALAVSTANAMTPKTGSFRLKDLRNLLAQVQVENIQ